MANSSQSADGAFAEDEDLVEDIKNKLKDPYMLDLREKR